MPEATISIIFVTSFVVALSGAMMPGPLLAVTIGEAARRGFWAGPLLILGHGILELGLVVALALGLSELIGRELISGIVGLIGGIILVAIGFAIIRGWWKATIPVANSPGVVDSRTMRLKPHDLAQPGKGRLIAMGIIASVSNPYWFIWWLTLGTTYMLWSLQLGITGIASFFSGHILADLSWYALISAIIATGRRVINDTAYRGLLVTCGLAVLALGGYFIVSGLGFLGLI